ncbi:MAG: hypothetical protein WA939_17540 [Nodosilinea sp.]
MAAAIVTAGTSLEAQALEISTALGELEKTQSTDLEPLNNVTIDTDLETGLVNITMSLPVTVAPTASGFSVAVDPYLA